MQSYAGNTAKILTLSKIKLAACSPNTKSRTRSKATLTGTEDLHGYELLIRKKADETVLFSKEGHTHGLTLAIEETWTNDVTRKRFEDLEI